MTFQQYSQELLDFVTAHRLVTNVALRLREIAENEGHVEGHLTLVGGLRLHVSEYVFTASPLMRSKYRYHVQDASGVFVCRWDNAPHHLQIETFPDHLHVGERLIQPSPPMDIPKVLAALTKRLA